MIDGGGRSCADFFRLVRQFGVWTAVRCRHLEAVGDSVCAEDRGWYCRPLRL
jgi:hypothetical protein